MNITPNTYLNAAVGLLRVLLELCASTWAYRTLPFDISSAILHFSLSFQSLHRLFLLTLDFSPKPKSLDSRCPSDFERFEAAQRWHSPGFSHFLSFCLCFPFYICNSFSI